MRAAELAAQGTLLLGVGAVLALGSARAGSGQAVRPHAAPVRLQTDAGQLREGYALFMNRTCASCHAIRGTPAAGRVGPDLTHFGSRLTIAAGVLPNTPANLARWLKRPQEIKPGCLMPDLYLTDEQTRKLVVFLEHLK